jgi:Fur family ferric uptake transcriptional regulator
LANARWLAQLKQAGYKITPPRLAVLEAIEAGGEHLQPAELLDAARERYPALGRATVYRTLELLTQLGIVRPIYAGDVGPTYIRAMGGHHHLVCSQCGLIVDFDECVAEEMIADLHDRFGFAITSHLLEFYGLCAACQAAAADAAE